jgi:hypothetical protein
LFNPAAISKTFAAVKTMYDCMALTATGEVPCMLAMAHQPDNEENVVSLVVLNIAALNEFLHLNNPLSEAEIEALAEKIVYDYGGALSFADLHLILENAKNGRYGKFYERLSSVDVLSWFDKWFNERCNEAANRSIGEHERAMQRIKEKQVAEKDVAFQLFKESIQKNNYKLTKEKKR